MNESEMSGRELTWTYYKHMDGHMPHLGGSCIFRLKSMCGTDWCTELVLKMSISAHT